MKLDRHAISIAPRAKVAQEVVLVLEDGTVFRGRGLRLFGQTLGEVCFNTPMTGYQEILTDNSYAGQIITFTFPHIGSVGTNDEDVSLILLHAAASCARTLLPPPIGGHRRSGFTIPARSTS
jgi:carbamoylphosphate synthase small subunit